MSLTTFFLCILPLTVGSVWAFAAMMKNWGKRKMWDPQRTFWTSALLYGLLGYFIPTGLLLVSGSVSEGLLYWMLIATLLAPVYLLINVLLNRQEKQKLKAVAPAPKGEISFSSSPVSHGQERIAKPPSEKAPVVLPPAPEKAAGRTAPKASPSRIFVSYRRSDSADVAGRIYDRLVGKFGKSPIFKDVDSIPLGLDFKEYLDQKVGECDVLLAVIGDHWLDAVDSAGRNRLEDPTDFVRIEIEAALERGIPVIPLLVRGAEMPGPDKLPQGLRKLAFRNGIPVRSDPDFHRDMDRLISALENYVS